MSPSKPVLIMGAGGRYRLPATDEAAEWRAATAGHPEVWSCNGLNSDTSGLARMFELHNRAYLKAVHADFADYERRLQHLSAEIAVYTFRPWPKMPSVLYPKPAVERLSPLGQWHCGTFDWMIALAILEQRPLIRLWGIGFSRCGEPIGAPACSAYWVGLAQGRGIAVEFYRCDTFGKTYQLLESERQYGYEDMVLVEGTKAKAKLQWPGI